MTWYRVWIQYPANHYAHPGQIHEWFADAENGDAAERRVLDQTLGGPRAAGFQALDAFDLAHPMTLRSFERGGWWTQYASIPDVLERHAIAFGGSEPLRILCRYEDAPGLSIRQPLPLPGFIASNHAERFAPSV